MYYSLCFLGWGNGSEPILQEIELKSLHLHQEGQFLENYKDKEEGKSTGGGDSGGPLTFKDTDQSHTLIGVISFGEEGRIV